MRSYFILQLDEVIPHNGSFQLGDMSEDQEKEEKKKVTVQEPEITRETSETDAGFRYKRDERYRIKRMFTYVHGELKGIRKLDMFVNKTLP